MRSACLRRRTGASRWVALRVLWEQSCWPSSLVKRSPRVLNEADTPQPPAARLPHDAIQRLAQPRKRRPRHTVLRGRLCIPLPRPHAHTTPLWLRRLVRTPPLAPHPLTPPVSSPALPSASWAASSCFSASSPASQVCLVPSPLTTPTPPSPLHRRHPRLPHRDRLPSRGKRPYLSQTRAQRYQK